MTVEKLIQELQKHPLTTKVVVNGYEGGFDEVDSLYTTFVAKANKNSDKWWLGELEEALSKNSEMVIVLPRKS